MRKRIPAGFKRSVPVGHGSALPAPFQRLEAQPGQRTGSSGLREVQQLPHCAHSQSNTVIRVKGMATYYQQTVIRYHSAVVCYHPAALINLTLTLEKLLPHIPSEPLPAIPTHTSPELSTSSPSSQHTSFPNHPKSLTNRPRRIHSPTQPYPLILTPNAAHTHTGHHHATSQAGDPFRDG